MKKLPIERSVLKFNGELEIDNDLGYGEEIVVVVKARVGAPAFTELKQGLKQINKAEVVSLHLATTDERVELEMYLDGGSQLPLPFTEVEVKEETGQPVYVLDQEAPVAFLSEEADGDDFDPEPVRLDSPPRRPAGTNDPILARFLESDR